MARLALNKASLHREAARLKTYARVLPSLDMKRRQLIAERAKALEEQKRLHGELSAALDTTARQLPMLANRHIDLGKLVSLKAVHTDEENLLGTRLPAFQKVDIVTAPYPWMGLPHWVDDYMVAMKQYLELAARMAVQRRRVALLQYAVTRITQRVNLFEKVLIPRSRENIRRLRIYLADQERAAVVRAKLAKNKRRESLS